MAIQNYKVAYSLDGLIYTDLTNVVSFSANLGRRAQLDQYNASSAQVVLRYPTGYASPITALVTGTLIYIYNSGSRDIMFGRISNVEVKYGLPYVAGVGNADYVTISVEGSFAQVGRLQGLNYSMIADTIANQMTYGFTQTGFRMFWSQTLGGIGGSGPTMAATTISSTWGDWLNRSALTTNARMRDGAQDEITLLSPYSLAISTVNFSDTANNATNQVYDQIEFESLADNYYTQVTVTPESFGAQTVLKVGAVKPYRTLQTNTFNASTTQAADYANYLLSNYQTAKFAIGSISCLANAQSQFRLDRIGTNVGVHQMIGVQVSVTFRGTTYQAVIEGVSVTGTPESSRYTYYLSGADLNAYLLLDNATFGRLDYNKLGY